MSDSPTAARAANRMGSGAGRVFRAWQTMPHERRLAAYASLGLFLSLFLPWYQREFFVVLGGKIQPASDSQTAWGAFSFVEAAVLLVAAGVLTLLFQRAEGKAFHIPGGDGGVITAAGVWTSILVIWRIFDKQGGNAHGQNATTYGIEWGIFVALAVAILLVYAGSRIRAAHRPEPPLPGEAADADAASPASGGDGARAGGAGGAGTPNVPPRPSQRPVGWLTARPGAEAAPEKAPPRPARPRPAPASPARPRPAPASPAPADPAPTTPATARRRPPPRPDPPPPPATQPTEPRQDPPPPLPPSTPAARRRRQADEQMTIPLERDE